MEFKSLSSGIKSYILNSSNHTHLQSVRKCSFCLMTYGHRKIIWHLFCIEMIPFTVRGFTIIPASHNVVMRFGWNPHPTFSNRQNNCNIEPAISHTEWGYHTLSVCRLYTVLFQFAKLVRLQLLASVVNIVRNCLSVFTAVAQQSYYWPKYRRKRQSIHIRTN